MAFGQPNLQDSRGEFHDSCISQLSHANPIRKMSPSAYLDLTVIKSKSILPTFEQFDFCWVYDFGQLTRIRIEKVFRFKTFLQFLVTYPVDVP